MRPPFCPKCGVGNYLHFTVVDGITFEKCGACFYLKRLTPIARPSAPKLPMLVGVCKEENCGREFEYQQKRTQKKAPEYCPPCRKGRYRGRKRMTPYGGALRKVG